MICYIVKYIFVYFCFCLCGYRSLRAVQACHAHVGNCGRPSFLGKQAAKAIVVVWVKPAIILPTNVVGSPPDFLGLRERQVLDMNLSFSVMNANGGFVPTQGVLDYSRHFSGPRRVGMTYWIRFNLMQRLALRLSTVALLSVGYADISSD